MFQAYHLALPPELAHIHNMFHVFLLKYSVNDPTHLLDCHPTSMQEGLEYEETPFQIVDRQELMLKNKGYCFSESGMATSIKLLVRGRMR